MRLAYEQISFIKQTVAEYFGSDARIWLFGSRVDDVKRGGDVDLYVEPVDGEALFDRRVRCLGKLGRGLPYPVDLIVAEPGAPRAVDRQALKEGVRL